jgi:peroxiredoxin
LVGRSKCYAALIDDGVETMRDLDALPEDYKISASETLLGKL